MKIYVAGASMDRQRVASIAAALARSGNEIVSTWHATDYDREREHELSIEARAEVARRCLEEVASAECVVAIGNLSMRGALWECGYAMGRGICVEWLGDRTATMFSTLAPTHVGTAARCAALEVTPPNPSATRVRRSP